MNNTGGSSLWPVQGGTGADWRGPIGAGLKTSFTLVFDQEQVQRSGFINNFGHDPDGNPWLNFNVSGQPGPWPPDQFGTVIIPLGVKSKVVYSCSPNFSRTYVDGVLSGNFAGGYTMNFSDYILHSENSFFRIHDLKVWDCALSPQQIASL